MSGVIEVNEPDIPLEVLSINNLAVSATSSVFVISSESVSFVRESVSKNPVESPSLIDWNLEVESATWAIIGEVRKQNTKITDFKNIMRKNFAEKLLNENNHLRDKHQRNKEVFRYQCMLC